jgi:A/G-specific adenine glycosylase
MSDFIGKIHFWYNINKRELPWRQTTDPYKIWLSEIILQQTRVAQGLGYYQRFIEQFPAVKNLALASEDEVLKLWQGLGYYSRARNLHSAAKYIHYELSGRFPSEYNDIEKLKGVGSYTAAAVASIAFNLSFPVVDGNIYRLFSRFFGILTPIDSSKGKAEIYQIAKELMPANNPGVHNQSLMEFGALQCVPKSPNCQICPVLKHCFAANNKMVDQLPVKSKKTIQKERYFYYYLIESGETIYIQKRTKTDIWKNLYQFPLFEAEKRLTEEELLLAEIPFLKNCPFTLKSISPEKKHVLSHQIIFARLIHIELEDLNDIQPDFFKINKKDIAKFAVPKLLENFIEKLDFL